MTALWIVIAALTLLNLSNWLMLLRLERRLNRMITVWTPTVPSVPNPHFSRTEVGPRYPPGAGWDNLDAD